MISGANSTVFTLKNGCPYTIWPSTTAPNDPSIKTWFELATGASVSLQVNGTWSGSFWARTNCSKDSTGNFSCLTGDCGTGKPECSDKAGVGPASHIDFSLMGIDSNDQYVISLVYGFNVPVSVAPKLLDCRKVTCSAAINAKCPPELQAKAKDGSIVGCKSACLAFGTEEHCCKFGVSSNCESTDYSEFFRKACPQAYSLPYLDRDITSTCRYSDYAITFCP